MEEYDEIKDMKHLAWFIGTSIVVIVIGLYVLLHKEIKAVENRFVPLEEQTADHNTSLDEANKSIDALEGKIKKLKSAKAEKKQDAKDCNEQAITQAVEAYKTDIRIQLEAADELGGYFSDRDMVEIRKKIENGTYNIEDYDTSFTNCMRSKGYVDFK